MRATCTYVPFVKRDTKAATTIEQNGAVICSVVVAVVAVVLLSVACGLVALVVFKDISFFKENICPALELGQCGANTFLSN